MRWLLPRSEGAGPRDYLTVAALFSRKQGPWCTPELSQAQCNCGTGSYTGTKPEPLLTHRLASFMLRD